jgi:outer membrane protein TolC
MRRRTLLLVLVLLAAGCTRAFYRRAADRETYRTLGQHMDETRWPVANIDIDAPPSSRLFDPFDPNRPPMPPDDPAAYTFMERPNGMKGSKHYHRFGDAPFIESPDWLANLPLDRDGKLPLTPERAVELGLLNSREYQTALENLYLTALTLTLDRFEFACHWIGTNDTIFQQFGSSATELNTLTTSSELGFSRNLAAGGQLIADITNSFLFTFSGIDKTVATSTIPVTFMQPLLRGAGRWVRLDVLTQSERNVLYAVRNFAHFRKQFYVNLTTQANPGYLGLLFQVQNIRNLQANLESQDQNVRLNEALFVAGTVSTVQVDQAFTSYLQGKLSLLQAQTALGTSLDTYKRTLGLPPQLPVVLDDALLAPFQLNAPELEKLQGEVDRFFASFREREQPPELTELRQGFRALRAFYDRAVVLVDQVEKEFGEWKVGEERDESQRKREQATHENLAAQFPDLRMEMADLARSLARNAGELTEPTRRQGWEALQDRSRQLIAALAQIYVIEAQIRVYLIRLRPVPYTLDEATAYARDNRYDLMNQRARVVDAWREITVAAHALRAGLNVTLTANVVTQPFADNPVDFRSTASSYTAGVQFDGPLNRQAERNVYRRSQIAYQQARRDFMALEDQIEQAIRDDMRGLELQRANFGIARLSLISAARQLEAANDKLLLIPDAANTTATQDVLTALTAVLQAKQVLISSWIAYETDRIQLLLDMEALQLDSRGMPIDESDDTPLHAPTPLPAGEQPQPPAGP